MDTKGNAKSDTVLKLTERRLFFQKKLKLYHAVSIKWKHTVPVMGSCNRDIWQCLVIIRLRFPSTGLIEIILPTMEARLIAESPGS